MKNDNLNYEPMMLLLIVAIYVGWVAIIGVLVWQILKWL